MEASEELFTEITVVPLNHRLLIGFPHIIWSPKMEVKQAAGMAGRKQKTKLKSGSPCPTMLH